MELKLYRNTGKAPFAQKLGSLQAPFFEKGKKAFLKTKQNKVPWTATTETQLFKAQGGREIA